MHRRFSIIIVHRNGADMLLKALASLDPACDRGRDEILLVDNGSSDDSVARVSAAYPHIHVIANACNNGFARACNQAIGRASGEFIVLLNNDAFIARDVLEVFAETFRAHPRAAIVAGLLLDAAGNPQRSHGRIPRALDELGLRRRRRPAAPHGLTEVESVVGACMAVRAEAIRDAGSLDNDFFFYYEETEWCHRLRAHGWQILLEPRARITHLKGVSTRGRRRGAQVEFLRSRLLFYRKTQPLPVAALLTINRVLHLLVNTAAHIVATVVTLGLVAKFRTRLAEHLLQLAWLASGCPRAWGLPDKCPRERVLGT